jgi:hypothetical protein
VDEAAPLVAACFVGPRPAPFRDQQLTLQRPFTRQTRYGSAKEEQTLAANPVCRSWVLITNSHLCWEEIAFASLFDTNSCPGIPAKLFTSCGVFGMQKSLVVTEEMVAVYL